eukprot:COSAG01_NODE_1504_length_10094_cov_24.449925_10_plen_105_part_00
MLNSTPSLLRASRVVTLGSSCMMMLMAVFVSQLGTQLAELSWVLNGLCGGPLLGVFLLGMLSRTAEAGGALVGVGESKRLVVESSWSQFISTCQRYWRPPRLNN